MRIEDGWIYCTGAELNAAAQNVTRKTGWGHGHSMP